jgi:hypothetical protein
VTDSTHPTNQEQPDHPRRRLFWTPHTSGFRIRITREFWIRIAIAAGLIVLSLFTNRSFLVWGLIATLAVLVVPTGRARSFIASIVPYAGIWFIFTFLRSLADETVLAQTLNTKVPQFERWLFGGELPSIRLQAKFYHAGVIHPWDYYFTFVHWSYFIIPHAVFAWLWWKHKRRFQQFLGALTLLLSTGLLIYFIIPTNPPWMAPESIDSPGAPVVLRIMEPIAKQLGGGLYQAGYKIVGESNPIAAMPSIHFAVTFLLVWAARGQGRVWQILAWFYAFSMGLALVYMGEHYVVDVIVGGMVTTYSWFAAGAWLRRYEDTEVAELFEPDVPPPAGAVIR